MILFALSALVIAGLLLFIVLSILGAYLKHRERPRHRPVTDLEVLNLLWQVDMDGGRQVDAGDAWIKEVI